MAAITYNDGIAIGRLVYFTPALLISIFLCLRHGFMKSSGWFFLVTFCLIRLIGSGAQLATIDNPLDSTAYTISLVSSIMGTSPLLLSSLGLLARLYYSILTQFWSIVFQFGVLKVVQTPAVIALVLCIVGATSTSSPADIGKNTTVHIGIILFLVVYVEVVLLTVVAAIFKKKLPEQERNILKAVGLALPFIFVHILYSLLSAFTHDRTFDLTSDTPTAYLFMEVLEEMVVSTLYIFAGLRAKSTPLGEDATGAQVLGYRFGRGDFGTGKLGLISAAVGLFNAFAGGNQRKAQTEDRRHRDNGQYRQHGRRRHSHHSQPRRPHHEQLENYQLLGRGDRRTEPERRESSGFIAA